VEGVKSIALVTLAVAWYGVAFGQDGVVVNIPPPNVMSEDEQVVVDVAFAAECEQEARAVVEQLGYRLGRPTTTRSMEWGTIARFELLEPSSGVVVGHVACWRDIAGELSFNFAV
jgi:hypothetical protein